MKHREARLGKVLPHHRPLNSSAECEMPIHIQYDRDLAFSMLRRLIDRAADSDDAQQRTSCADVQGCPIGPGMLGGDQALPRGMQTFESR